MLITDSIAADVSTPETGGPEIVWGNRPLSERGTSACVGDHGDQYAPTPPAPAIFEAHIECGCSIKFPVPTMPGEMLYCIRHDGWYVSTPVPTDPKPETQITYYARCLTCNKEYGPLSRTALYTRAKRHAVGKTKRTTPPHRVEVGRTGVVEGEITWKEYVYTGKQ